MAAFTPFAVWALLLLNTAFFGQRLWTLVGQGQSPHGRAADVLLIAFYGSILLGLWPLTIGG